MSSSKRLSFGERMVGLVPQSLQPYAKLMRLDKLTGVFNVMLPMFWSIALSTPASHLPSVSALALFAFLSVLMRSSGCVINDIFDKDFDKQIERTKDRPLACKQLRIADSLKLFVILSGTGTVIFMQFDTRSLILFLLSLPLITIYPLIKRYSYWPQLFLGITVGWPIIVASSVVTEGAMNWSGLLPLFIAGSAWTLIYDTIYAYQDMKYDLKIGVKSTTIRFSENPKMWLGTFSLLMCLGLVMTGVNTNQLWPFYTAVTFIAIKLCQIISALNIKDMEKCLQIFDQNSQIGWMLLIGISASTYFKTGISANYP